MTVAELIKALEALSPDLRVLMPSNQSADFVAPVHPILDTMQPTEGMGWELCDYEDDGATTVVRLLGRDEADDRDSRPKPPTH